MVKVQTVYGSDYGRSPNISEYKTREEAEQFIETCLKWGIDIVSCEIIGEKEQ